MKGRIRACDTHVDVDPLLLGEGFVFVHENAFSHGDDDDDDDDWPTRCTYRSVRRFEL